MRAWWTAVACGLAVVTLAGQSTPDTSIGFAVAPSHDGAALEVETATNGIVPCVGTGIVGTERTCRATFSRTTAQTIRLRAVNTFGASAWSPAVAAPAVPAGSPPGAYTITLARPVAAPPGSPPMAVAHVQSTGALSTPFTGDGVADLTFAGNTTIGNLILVGFYIEATSRTVTSVTAGGATLTLLSQGGVDATIETGAPAELWVYGGVATSATTAVQITISSAFAGVGKCWAAEFSGQHATFASAIEDVAIATNTGAGNHDSGNVTTANAGSMLVGFLGGTTGVYTIDADFTPFTGTGDGFMRSGYDVVDAVTASFNTTSGGSETTAQVVIAIAPAAGGGGRTVLNTRSHPLGLRPGMGWRVQ
jgi:hypothetical protein